MRSNIGADLNSESFDSLIENYLTKRLFYEFLRMFHVLNSTLKQRMELYKVQSTINNDHVQCTLNEESNKISRTTKLELLKGHQIHEMSDVEESSTEALGGLSLYTEDTPLPDYVSSASVSTVGSSVSQSKKNTIEVNADMFNNAMTMLLNLQKQVFF